jgi:hypothetical protein
VRATLSGLKETLGRATEREMQEAIAFHIAGPKADGLAVPKRSSSSSYVEIPLNDASPP